MLKDLRGFRVATMPLGFIGFKDFSGSRVQSLGCFESQTLGPELLRVAELQDR